MGAGGGARAHNKNGAPPRGGWHSFDEYAFLEDSRYASQPENAMPRVSAGRISADVGRARATGLAAWCICGRIGAMIWSRSRHHLSSWPAKHGPVRWTGPWE